MATAHHETDILIVGGGIAGLALAALLGRAGVGVALVEPSPPQDIRPSGRTVALMESSLNIIRATGAWESLAIHACPMRAMRIIDDSRPGKDSRIEIEFPAADLGLEQFGFNVPNALLRAGLYETVLNIPGIRLFAPDRLLSFEETGLRIEARLESGSCISARLIVGADGRNSRVRDICGIPVHSHDYGQKAITCLINHSRAHDNVSTEFHRPSGPFALVPLPGNVSSVVWVETTDRADALLSLRKEEFQQALQAQTLDVLAGITLETGPESWPLQAITADSLVAGRAVILAEAAHVMSPITAQGLNLSLRDIAALAETAIDAMRAGLDPGEETILGRYARRRNLDMKTRVFGVDRMNRAVSTDSALIRSLRRAGLKGIDSLPPLKNLAMQTGLAPRLDIGRLGRGEAL